MSTNKSAAPAAASAPCLVSMCCHPARAGATYGWHSHSFYELTLVTEDATKIGYPAGERHAQPNTLLLYRPSESHGAWNTPEQAPSFWVVHFGGDLHAFPVLATLANQDPRQRVWQLTRDQTETFKWLFLQILNEQTQQRENFPVAQSSWLQLLLISIQRWSAGASPIMVNREMVNPELLRLWHVVNASAQNPADTLHQICVLPNYDSLRHSFRRVFGCSPREMMLRLRMQHAQNLLLETGLSIKEVAARTGYSRQHEFARAFRQRVGMPPSQWRRNPFPGGGENYKVAKPSSSAAKDVELQYVV